MKRDIEIFINILKILPLSFKRIDYPLKELIFGLFQWAFSSIHQHMVVLTAHEEPKLDNFSITFFTSSKFSWCLIIGSLIISSSFIFKFLKIT